MKIWNRIKNQLPISRATHEAALKAERERLRVTLASRQKEIESERKADIERVRKLIERLVTVQWRRHELYQTYGVELNLSAQMMRYATDPRDRGLIAEAIGQQIAAEVRRANFLI
jgi:hypothetical protein